MTLKERRIAAGFENASDLARVIGISPSRMWRLESGSQSLDNLDEEHKILLANSLKCKVDEMECKYVFKVSDYHSFKRHAAIDIMTKLCNHHYGLQHTQQCIVLDEVATHYSAGHEE